MRYIVSCFLAFLVCSSANSKQNAPIVVLLSIDGLSYEYLNKHKPSNILALAKSGVKAKLQPVYPTKTFPNHLSIITGSYPINHGISNNVFFNPILNKIYAKGDGKNNAAWLTADPLWHIAEKQGIKTAVYFWPESEIKGKKPTYNIPFNKTDSNKARLDQIIRWLQLPTEQRPQFITSYFSSVDSAGHHYGPNSKELVIALEEIDILIGDFVKTLAKEINHEVNIIIVSDHGMLAKDKTKVIKQSMIFDEKVRELIKSKKLIVAKNDTQLYLYFRRSNSIEQEYDHLVDTIKKDKKNTKLFRLYSKGQYPKHWQLDTKTELVPDIILEALPPATFVKEDYNSKLSNPGTHGYDVTNQKDLMGMFIASGPDILKNDKTIKFENIHVFPFISKLLDIKTTSRIDGKYEILSPYIKNH